MMYKVYYLTTTIYKFVILVEFDIDGGEDAAY